MTTVSPRSRHSVVRTAPYSAEIDTSTWDNGTYTVTATASDLVGNTARATVQVVVQNLPKTIVMDNLAVGQTSSNRSFNGTFCTELSGTFFKNPALYSCGSGTDLYTFTPDFKVPGAYKVYVRYVAATDRSQQARIYLSTANAFLTLSVDMTTKGGTWVLLGQYNFNASAQHVLRISDESGPVSVDGVKYVPVQL